MSVPAGQTNSVPSGHVEQTTIKQLLEAIEAERLRKKRLEWYLREIMGEKEELVREQTKQGAFFTPLPLFVASLNTSLFWFSSPSPDIRADGVHSSAGQLDAESSRGLRPEHVHKKEKAQRFVTVRHLPRAGPRPSVQATGSGGGPLGVEHVAEEYGQLSLVARWRYPRACFTDRGGNFGLSKQQSSHISGDSFQHTFTVLPTDSSSPAHPVWHSGHCSVCFGSGSRASSLLLCF